MAYTRTEKIGMIDTRENRMIVAEGIANGIFIENKLEGNDTLKTWLIDAIMADTLADIIDNEQKFYIIELANKCAADIIYSMQDKVTIDNFMEVCEGFGCIGKFLGSVCSDLDIDLSDFYCKAADTASVFGYEDTLIINDTMYVYDNGSKERVLVTSEYSIGYHSDYTCKKIERRIKNRLRYKWDVDIKLVEVTQNEDKTFSAKAVFLAPKEDVGDISNKLLHRFGSTSGRPWHRCKVAKFEVGE